MQRCIACQPWSRRIGWSSQHYKPKRCQLHRCIHDGRILGLPGKILAFIASLIGASLPITGFIFWIRRKRKRKTM
ncbi:PepSY domain-containing protein [Bacteroides sp. 51]|uniref:PepSY domain-containing protein n=1 Tax=Bacteroides sp. 51 TaxID=2302938 RepID=UPI00351B6117